MCWRLGSSRSKHQLVSWLVRTGKVSYMKCSRLCPIQQKREAGGHWEGHLHCLYQIRKAPREPSQQENPQPACCKPSWQPATFPGQSSAPQMAWTSIQSNLHRPRFPWKNPNLFLCSLASRCGLCVLNYNLTSCILIPIKPSCGDLVSSDRGTFWLPDPGPLAMCSHVAGATWLSGAPQRGS